MQILSALPRLAAFLFFIGPLMSYAGESPFPRIDPKNVTIVRDSFGIPHIFGNTDAEVAYGLAWANAEDAFHITQDLIYTATGNMARKDGINGAKVDFFVHAIGARQLVEERFEKDLSVEFKKYLDGYVQGLNAYAAAHPEEVMLKRVFPVNSEDVVTAYVIIMSGVCGVQGQIGDAVTGKFDNVVVDFAKVIEPTVGSNAFALNTTKTVDGKTLLCINPHLQMDGLLSFYEAHLHSNEGLNMEGCMFQGSTSLAMGVNENLGWGMTWNYFDKVDVYKLKMHERKKLVYELDGQWKKLEKRPVWLKVALGKKKNIVLPVKRMTYRSEYGITLKSDKSDNFFSIRFPANMTIQTGEQLYKMNKAKNHKEYWDALHMQALSMFNIVYADKDDNIFYLSNGMVPVRDPQFNWKGMLPGNTSATLWTKLVPTDSLPYTANPDCGYVFNTNNSPFHASGDDCNESHCPVPRHQIDERPGDNNRAVRFKEIINSKDKFSLEDMKALKFDVTISRSGKFAETFEPLFNLDEAKYPDIAEAIRILKTWNRKAEINEVAPSIFGFVVRGVFKTHHCGDDCFVSGIVVPEEEFVSELRKACDSLRAHYGTVQVEWGTLHRNIRGNVDMPLRGFPDVLSPSYPEQMPGTMKFKVKHGDTYTMFAVFGSNGVETLEALQPAGNSLNPDSKHYNDQIELFSRQEMRKLSLRREEVMKKAASVYHPG